MPVLLPIKPCSVSSAHAASIVKCNTTCRLSSVLEFRGVESKSAIVEADGSECMDAKSVSRSIETNLQTGGTGNYMYLHEPAGDYIAMIFQPELPSAMGEN